MSRYPGRYDGLTVKQADLLSFIRERAAMNWTPSFEEMGERVGVGKSAVHRLVVALAERGYITRLENRARAIVPVEDPQPCTTGELRPVAMLPTAVLANELRKRGYIVRDAA